MRAGIPYRVFGGVKFYDRREVKDALAYLRALVNPDDEVSWKRIVNTPKRGVGDTSVAKVVVVRAGRGRHVPRSAACRRGRGSRGPGARRHPRPARSPRRDHRRSRRRRRAHDRSRARAHRVPRRAAIRALGRVGRAHREPAGADRRRAGVRRARSTRATSAASSRSAGLATGDPDSPGGRAAVGDRPDGTGAGVPRGSVARHRSRRRRSRPERGHADDAALGEGARVPGRVHARSRRRRLPARAQPR